jgi:ribosomal protein L7/L12
MSEQWYYTKERQQTGPVDFAKLKELATTGQIAATDLVWKAGMLSWLPASQIPGLLSEGPPLVPDVPAWLVLLEWFQADKKIPLIKELQRLAGVPISRGKQLLEKCPCLIHTAPFESEGVFVE